MNDFKKQLNNFKQISPDQAWKEQNKLALMRQLEAQLGDERETIGVKGVVFGLSQMMSDSLGWRVLKPAFTMLMIFAVVFGGGEFTVNAAKQSLPGDNLYFVKRALENAQLKIVANDHEERVRFEVGLVAERYSEARKLAQLKKSLAELGPAVEQIHLSADQINNTMKLAAEGASSGSEGTQVRLKLARIVDEELAGLEAAWGEDDNAEVDLFVVEAVVNSVQRIEFEALKVMAETYEGGMIEPAQRNEISDRINKEIEQVANEVKKVRSEQSANNQSSVVEGHSEVESSVEGEVTAESSLEEASKLVENEFLISAIEKISETSEAFKSSTKKEADKNNKGDEELNSENSDSDDIIINSEDSDSVSN